MNTPVNTPVYVRDLGEQALLKRLYQFCPTDLVGDDAALISIAPGHSLVVTTDMLIDTVHFSDQTTSPIDVGWRSAAANLSDLAAMGADPLGITVGLGLPGHLPVSWIEALYQGIVDCLQHYNTAIVGGDVCRSSVTTVSITAFGQVLPHQAIKRSNAKPGDAIVVTGVHGASRAGLELLLNPDLQRSLPAEPCTRLIQAHQRPKPRLDVIPIVRDLLEHQTSDSENTSENTPENTSVAIAGMDSSDGLADAVLQICRASQVGARLDRDRLPVSPDVIFVPRATAIDWALYGGEDFELVLCLADDVAKALVEKLGNGAAIVGTITDEPNVILTSTKTTAEQPTEQPTEQNYPDEVLSLDKGFQHF